MSMTRYNRDFLLLFSVNMYFSYLTDNKSCTSFLCWTGSCTIRGQRVQVYQPEFEEPWALGLVSQHDLVTHIMEIVMDQVRVKGRTLSVRIYCLIRGLEMIKADFCV